MDLDLSGSGSSQSRRTLRKEDYSIGWVSALWIELQAALACLDERHNTLQKEEGDQNAYVFGRMHQHNIVLACLPTGDYGNNSAANVAVHMRRSFPSIQLLLLVGIAGAIPLPADVRLGDVVVGQRIIQHDLGKEIKGDDFIHTAPMHHLHSSVASTLSVLRASLGLSSVGTMLLEAQITHTALKSLLDRSLLCDNLHESSYDHENDLLSCGSCDETTLVKRKPRLEGDEVVIHYGTIASGDQVIKNARLRDEIGRKFDAFCIEMEAAGLKHDFPSLVVRGICDYADSHKHKEWQPYAAATAAVLAKKFLEFAVLKAAPDIVASLRQHEAPVDEEKKKHRKDMLNGLSFEQIDARYENLNDHHDGTCEWINQHPTYLLWLDRARHLEHHGFLWIRGKAGVGKSTIIKYLFEHTRKTARSSDVVLAFFFNARGSELEKSIIGMYRSVLFQLLKKVPELQAVLDDCDGISWPMSKLHRVLSKAVSQLGRRRFTLFIDALDECDEEECLTMLTNLRKLASNAFSDAVTLRICFSSRPYPVVHVGRGLQIVLEEQAGHARDLRQYVHTELCHWPQDVQNELSVGIMKRAQGVFLWAVLVLALLSRDLRRGRIEANRVKDRLDTLPPQLHDLFQDIIEKDQGDRKELQLCIQWILYAKRPLSPREYHRAMMLGINPESEENFQEWNGAKFTDQILDNFIATSSRGLAEATTSSHPTVQFIHESVKDFLIKNNGMADIFGHEVCDTASCHSRLANICHLTYRGTKLKEVHPPIWDLNGQRISPTDSAFPFFTYSLCNILYHAEQSAMRTSQLSLVRALDIVTWSKARKEYGYRYNDEDRILYHRSYVITRYTSLQTFLAGENLPCLLEQVIDDEGLLDEPVFHSDPALATATPLQIAVECNSAETAKVLLRKGADPNVVSDSHKPLKRAVHLRNKLTVHYLLAHGACTKVPGDTLFDDALDEHDFAIALALQSAQTCKHCTRLLGLEQKRDLSLAASELAALTELIDQGHLIHQPTGRVNGSHSAESLCKPDYRLRRLLSSLIAKQGSDIRTIDALLERRMGITDHDDQCMGIECSLCQAVRVQRIDIIHHLIRAGMEPVHDPTALFIAASQKYRSDESMEVMSLLLQHGAKTTPEAFRATCERREASLLRVLLSHGAERYTDKLDWHHLFAETTEMNLDILEALLEYGFSIGTLNSDHETLLHACVAKTLGIGILDDDITGLVLRYRANASVPDCIYGGKLRVAHDNNLYRTSWTWLQHGAEVNTKSGTLGPPLQAAYQGGPGSWQLQYLLKSRGRDDSIDALRLMKLLIKSGANVNGQGGWFGTALQAWCLNRETVPSNLRMGAHLLLDAGADVDFCSEGSIFGTALQAACYAGAPDLVRLLLDRGADINAEGGIYGSALQAACVSKWDWGLPQEREKCEDIAVFFEMDWLLSRGPEFDYRGRVCGAALQMMCRGSLRERRGIVELLLNRGARVTSRGGLYGSALKAAKRHNFLAVSLLTKYGASDNDTDGL